MYYSFYCSVLVGSNLVSPVFGSVKIMTICPSDHVVGKLSRGFTSLCLFMSQPFPLSKAYCSRLTVLGKQRSWQLSSLVIKPFYVVLQ